jgi:hypothetical protein
MFYVVHERSSRWPGRRSGCGCVMCMIIRTKSIKSSINIITIAWNGPPISFLAGYILNYLRHGFQRCGYSSSSFEKRGVTSLARGQAFLTLFAGPGG